ncbi:MAG: prepilin-type N-terminal cleavage/methylation domain-containing protein [Minisyncoccia bacterium]|jgi:prepilin-type N-terminal cleavage/methylation domain-containing protein
MKKGFTIVELLIVIGIIAIITTVSVLTLFNWHSTAVLTSTTKQIGALLREAQSNTMAQNQGAAWGVHFDNTTSTAAFYSLFYTFNGTYASSTRVGQYPLPAGICYATSSVNVGSSTDIIFSGISGQPSASVTIMLQLIINGSCSTATSSGSAASLNRSGSGLIFFDNFNRSNL